MARIRPTCFVNTDLVECDYSDEMKESLIRTFTHIAPIKVTSHPEKKNEINENIFYITVRFRAPFKNSSEESADENWNTKLRPWIEQKFERFAQTVDRYNKSFRTDSILHFRSLVLELGDIQFWFQQPFTDTFPNIGTLLETFRVKYNNDEFANKEITRVYFPRQSDELIEKELELICERDKKREEESQKNDEIQEQNSDESSNKEIEDVSANEILDDSIQDKDVQNKSESTKSKKNVDSIVLDNLDYNNWEVIYADGTSQEVTV